MTNETQTDPRRNTCSALKLAEAYLRGLLCASGGNQEAIDGGKQWQKLAEWAKTHSLFLSEEYPAAQGEGGEHDLRFEEDAVQKDRLLGARARITNPRQIASPVNGYIRRASSFIERTKEGPTVTSEMIFSRELHLIAPRHALPDQWEVLRRASNYSKGQDPAVTVRLFQKL